MAYCPTYTNPQVKADFNSIVEDYGGKPLSNMEFRSRKLRGERFGKDKFAMDVAYYMWDKHQGDMEQIFADKEGAKYRLSKPTEVYEQVEDVDLSLDHLTDAERSYLEAEATIYDPFADEERVYDTHKDRKRVTYVQNIESTPTEMSQQFKQSLNKPNTNPVLQNNKQQQVSELFDSNPELANEVYKALGFKTKSEIEVSNRIFNPDMAPDGYSKIIILNGKHIGEFALVDVGNEVHLSGSLGARTEIDAKYRGKGYGYQAYIELAKQVKSEGKVLVSGTTMTEDAIRVWEKLVKEGYANKVKRLVEGFNNFEEEVYIIDN